MVAKGQPGAEVAARVEAADEAEAAMPAVMERPEGAEGEVGVGLASGGVAEGGGAVKEEVAAGARPAEIGGGRAEG